MKASPEIADKVTKTIETIIGKIARPKRVHIVPDMPKTPSGTLMRRVLAAISNNLNTGDIATLANPDVVEAVREMVQGKEAVAVKDGPEDVKQVERSDEAKENIGRDDWPDRVRFLPRREFFPR